MESKTDTENDHISNSFTNEPSDIVLMARSDNCDGCIEVKVSEEGTMSITSDESEDVSSQCINPSCESCVNLQKQLKEEQKRCNILRENIHKVSANWFQRKTELSESEFDGEVHPVGLLNETTRIAGEGEDSPDDSDGGDKNERKRKESNGKSTGSNELSKLVNVIAQKSAQLDLSDSHCRDLKKKMREYEKIIDDKEDIIHGLKEQLEGYLVDNQQMSIQLNNLAALFQQLEKVDKESVNTPQVPEEESETTTIPLPTQGEFQEMASSVSRTYIKLKDLIYEKKALVTEIERLNTLNVELQRRVVQQENRLMSVSDALHQTWLVVSDLKDQHTKLHEDELVMRYELKEKRTILTKLRNELESARQQWQVIRQKNLESEQEYASIRAMLQARREESLEAEGNNASATEKEEEDEAVCLHPDDTKTFDPPVDLLLEMGLEYGIIGAEGEMTQTVLEVIRGEDVRNSRLEQLEEHCSLLYTKLLASTSRSLSLASRLSRLHRHFGSSDDEDDEEEYVEGHEEHEGDGEDEYHGEQEQDEDEDEGEDEVQYFTDANHMAVMDSVLSSPDSEEYDTAYVSETDGAEMQTDGEQLENIVASTSTSTNTSIVQTEVVATEISELIDNAENNSENGGDQDESCDHLSRTLINFLPRKIEFLRQENTRLENCLSTLKEEKNVSDENMKKFEKDKGKLEEEMKILTKEMTIEKLQKRQLEEQLKHLGKCVDELKLKHQSENKTPNQEVNEEENEEEPPSEDEPATEPRTEEEKHKEGEKLKKEVELVKKDMELRKKEKELKKKEEELSMRERQVSASGGGRPESTEADDRSTGTLHGDVAPARRATDAALIAAITEMITGGLQRKSSTVNQTVSPHPVENDTTSNKENVTLLPTTSNITSNSSLTSQEEMTERILLQSTVKPENLRLAEISSTVSLDIDGVLVIPVYMTAGQGEVACRIHPSEEASLLILQVLASPEHSMNCSPTTTSTSEGSSSNIRTNSHSTPDASSSSNSETSRRSSDTVQSDNTSEQTTEVPRLPSDSSATLPEHGDTSSHDLPQYASSLLVPVSLLPPCVSVVKLKARQSTTFVIVVRDLGSENTSVSFHLSNTDTGREVAPAAVMQERPQRGD